ncbi:uncharacterized protein LAESUDRAFT_713656 [Laetiporus sulphureus 93-53]|uniref:Uncharacterized protein n=1 Tax=Laetiporus sulphureus 93-53 TaxID=1314785 RepID=A0A165EIY1_9APHY|nr:uncharacterized protein LAESUDRAFT_713656 [Laetiporus sulphureus 93-53]KZT07146.1 hypothetical protein LAESUDRAFT_713656 [Laetiporus sulphureus 93-53]
MFSPSHPDFRIPSAAVEETSSSYAYQLPTLADDAAHRSWLVSSHISRRDSISAEARTSSEHHTRLLSDGGLRQPVPSSNAYVRGSPPEHLPSQRFGAQHGPSVPNHRQPPSRSWLLSSTEAQANASHASPELERRYMRVHKKPAIRNCGPDQAMDAASIIHTATQDPSSLQLRHTSEETRDFRSSHTDHMEIDDMGIVALGGNITSQPSRFPIEEDHEPQHDIRPPSWHPGTTFQASDRDVNIAQLYGRLQDVDDRMTRYNEVLLNLQRTSEAYLSALAEDIRSMRLAGSTGEKPGDCSKQDDQEQHSKDHAANYLRKCIHLHCFLMFDFTSTKNVPPPPSRHLMEALVHQLNQGTPFLMPFRYDWLNRFTTTYNCCVEQAFYRNFWASVDSCKYNVALIPERYHSFDEFLKVFRMHMAHLRKCWIQQKRPCQDGQDRVRAKHYSKNSRKLTTFKNRRNATSYIPAPEGARVYDLINMIGTAGISSDEEFPTPPGHGRHHEEIPPRCQINDGIGRFVEQGAGVGAQL